MKRDGIVNHHAALFLLILPVVNGHNLAGGTVNDLPPPLSVVSGVDHHQFFGNTLHKRNLQFRLHGSIKSSHHIALLYFIRIRLCPLVILPGGVIGGINFCPGSDQLLRELGAVAVTDGIRAPAFHQFYGFRHNIQISRNGYPSLC